MKSQHPLHRWIVLILSIALIGGGFPTLGGRASAKVSPYELESANVPEPSAAPSEPPHSLFTTSTEAKPAPTPMVGDELNSQVTSDASPVERKRLMNRRQRAGVPPMPDERLTVGKAAYEQNILPPALLTLKARTLMKQGLLDSKVSEETTNLRSRANQNKGSQDLSRTEIEQLFLAGASYEDVYGINLMMQGAAGRTPLELLKWRQAGKLTWEEIEQKLTGAAALAEPPSVPDSVYKNEGEAHSVAQRPSVMSLVYGEETLLDSQLQLASSQYTAFDSTVSGIFDGLVKQAQINQTNKPQYGDRELTSETVDPVSGSLTWKQNEIHLPGRDGLDLDIGIMYSSNQAHSLDIQYTSTGHFTARYDHYLTRYNLGTGWSLQFPSIQTVNGYSYYHDGQGGVFAVAPYPQNGDELTQYTQFLNFKSKNMRLISSNEFFNGDEFSFSCVEYADKRREYFSGRGLLLGIVDRYGNTITFKHKLLQYSGMNLEVISSITDSVGRVVTIEYENNLETEGDFYGENVTIRVKDGGMEVQKVTLTKGRVKTRVNELETYVPVLWVITDRNGDETFFNYDYQYAVYDPWSGYGGEQNYNYYSLLKGVTYPHSKTTYEYDQTVRNINSMDSIQEYRVTSREDSIGSKRYNRAQYQYEGDYTGYPSYNPKNITEDYRFYSTVKLLSDTASNNMTTFRTFNGKARLLSTDTQAANGERKVVTNTAFHELFQNSPTRTTISEYGAGDNEATANHLFKETTYTPWGWVGTETIPLTMEQFNNPYIKQRYTTTMSYEPNYHLMDSKSWYLNESDANPVSEHYTYTPEGRPLSVTNALGEQTTYRYQYNNGTREVSQAIAEKTAGGKIVAKSVTDYGDATKRAYPTEQQQWFNIGTPEQRIVKKTMVYDMRMGRLIRESDGNNQTVSYEYERGGRLKKETYPDRTNSNGERYEEVIEYNYYNETSPNFDAENAGVYALKVNSIHTVTKASTNQSLSTNSAVYYNGLGSAVMEERFDPNTWKWEYTHYHYDDQGRPVYSSDPAGNTLTVSYDAWGRQNLATNANNDQMISDYNIKTRTSTSYIKDHTNGEKLNYVEQSYDPWGNRLSAATYKDWPTNQQRIAESYRYDIMGNVTGYTDPNRKLNEDGVTTTFAYDALGRLTSLKDALNQTTSYSYDANGQVTKVTIQAKGGTPQALNTKSYNELGLPSVKQDGASQSESYTYNNLGQLTAKTDRNGSSFDYVYDESGQLKTSTIRGNINNVAQTQETKMIFGDGSPDKQTVLTLTNGVETASHTQTQNSLGQVRSVYSKSGAHAASIGNQLDVLGRMKQITDNYMGFSANYQYSKERLDKVQTNGSSTLNSDPSVNAQYSYYANNQIQRIVYPTLTDGSQLITTYSYNKALGWTETMQNTKGSGSLSSYTYSYDHNGNRISVSESRNGAAAQKTNYSYDALNRLISITRPDGGQTTYTYDVRGNRLTLSDTSTVSLDSADTSYTYDLQNTLTSVTKGGASTSFQYYADGMRFMKTIGNTQTQVNYNFQGQVISEEKIVNGDFVEQANFVRGDRVLVKKDKKAAKDYYYLYNGHGDVVQIVDTNGTVVNNYTYGEWGNITSQDEKTSNSFKYTGEVYDEETGLYYLRARYYDPSMGRFLNEDTVEGQIDNPLSQNLYTYVHNNPLIYSDPTGHMPHKLLNAFLSDFIGGRSNGTKYTSTELSNAVFNANGNNDSGRYKSFHEIAQIYAARQIHSASGQAVQLEFHLEEEINNWPNKHHYVDIVTGDNLMWEVKAMRVTHLGLGDGAWEDAEAQLLRYNNVNNELKRGYQLKDISGIVIVDQLRMDIEFSDLGKIMYSFYLDYGDKGVMPLTTKMAADYVSNTSVYPPSLPDIDFKFPGKGKRR